MEAEPGSDSEKKVADSDLDTIHDCLELGSAKLALVTFIIPAWYQCGLWDPEGGLKDENAAWHW